MGGSQSQNFTLELECPQLAPGQLPFGYVRSSTQTHRVADWEQPLELFIEDEDEVVVLTVYAAESRDRWKDGLARMHSEVYLPWSMMMEEQGSEPKRSWRLALDSGRILPDFFTDDKAPRQEYKTHFQEAVARSAASDIPVIAVTITRGNPEQPAPSSMPPRAAPAATAEPAAASAPPATWQQAPAGWQPATQGGWQANGTVSPRNGVAPGSSIPGGPLPPASEMELQHRTQRLERENRQLEEECRLLREENRRIREQPIPEQNVEAAFDQAVQDVQIHALQVQRLSEQLNASESKVMVLERQVLDLRNRQPDPNAAVVQSLREELNRSRDRNLRAIREYDAQIRLLEQELSDTKQALSQGVAVGDSNAESEVKDLRIQLEVHQTEVDELKRRLQEADKSREQQSGGVNDQLQSMEFRMQSWREQAEQIEQEKRQSEELNEKALREANAQISKLIDELDDKEAVIKASQSTIEELEQRQQQTGNVDESQDLELKDNEIRRLQQQLQIKDQQIAQLQQEWEGLATRAQSFVTASTRPATESSLEVATAKARIEELSQQHKDARARCEQLECDLKMAEVQNTVKATLISDLQRALQEKHRKEPEPARMTAAA